MLPLCLSVFVCVCMCVCLSLSLFRSYRRLDSQYAVHTCLRRMYGVAEVCHACTVWQCVVGPSQGIMDSLSLLFVTAAGIPFDRSAMCMVWQCVVEPS